MNVYSILRRIRRLANDIRGVGTKAATRILPERREFVRLPTMDEWWNLTARFPEFRRPSHTALKEYGYMAIMSEIQRLPPGARVLEFGHGFNATLLSWSDGLYELWGLDDYLPLPYNPPMKEWEADYGKLQQECSRAHFVRGVLGGKSVKLPEKYFDVVCSISVLEELRLSDLRRVLSHAHSLLKDGGLLINTHDWRVRNKKRFLKYLDVHREAGFDLGPSADSPPGFDLDELLLENPTAAMSWYQGSEGKHRVYRGHWTTIFTLARKA